MGPRPWAQAAREGRVKRGRGAENRWGVLLPLTWHTCLQPLQRRPCAQSRETVFHGAHRTPPLGKPRPVPSQPCGSCRDTQVREGGERGGQPHPARPGDPAGAHCSVFELSHVGSTGAGTATPAAQSAKPGCSRKQRLEKGLQCLIIWGPREAFLGVGVIPENTAEASAGHLCNIRAIQCPGLPSGIVSLSRRMQVVAEIRAWVPACDVCPDARAAGQGHGSRMPHLCHHPPGTSLFHGQTSKLGSQQSGSGPFPTPGSQWGSQAARGPRGWQEQAAGIPGMKIASAWARPLHGAPSCLLRLEVPALHWPASPSWRRWW